MKKEILGVDIGGVIIDRANDNTDTSFFSDNYLRTTAVPEVFESLDDLRSRFADRIHLVSKCGRNTQKKTLEWLLHNEFYARTGIAPDNIWFCRERSGKAPICERLGITHFVDDRLEILGSLKSVDTRYLFQPNPDEVQKHAQYLPLVRKVDRWDEIRKNLI